MQKKSLCRICSALCPIVVEVDDEGAPVAARGDKENPHSEGFFCLKGKHFPELHRDALRLRHSQRRDANGTRVPIASQQAIAEVADRLQTILDETGPDSIAVYCGTLFYALPQTASVAGAWMDALGLRMRYSTATIDQPGKNVASAAFGHWLGGSHVFDDADTWMLVGTNPLVAISGGVPHANPARRLQRARAKGLQLIVVDPRRTETAKQAALHLQPRPGTDPAVLAGILREVIHQGLVDETFVREETEGFEALRAAVEPFTPEVVAARADVPAQDLVRAATIFGRARRGSVTAGTGANMSGWSNISEYLVLCLNAICGRFRRAGERVVNPGILTPRRDFKAQALPPYPVDGYGPPLRTRDMTPAICGPPISALAEEILAPGPGRIRALISIGGNPLRAWPDQEKTRRALEALDLHVAVEPRLTDSARMADYVLAPKLPLESPGSTLGTETLFTVSPALGHTEAYGQYAGPIVAPPPGSDLLEDWEFFYGLGQAMGLELTMTAGVFPIPGIEMPTTPLDMQHKPSSEEVLDYVTKGSWIPIQRLRDEPDRVLFGDELAVDVVPKDTGHEARLCLGSDLLLAELREFAARDKFERATFDYRLISRRMSNTFNSIGTDIPGLRARYGTNPAFMHPDDLAREGLSRGDPLRLQSPHGALDAVAWPDPDLRPGLVSMCHCWGSGKDASEGSNVGRLISVDEDTARFSGIPLMSALPVRVSRPG